MMISHLPEGPTMLFRITSIVLGKQIYVREPETRLSSYSRGMLELQITDPK